LNYLTTEDSLRKAFEEFGKIVEINLKQKEAITFAFIEFSSTSEAEAAVSEMNHKTLEGL